MSLIHLISQEKSGSSIGGSQNQLLNIPRNFAIEYFTYDFNNYGLIEIPKDYNTIVPEYLEFGLSTENLISITDFKEMIHESCLELDIGGQRILTIPLRFMMHLKNCEICDNKIYVTIPFNLFYNEIKLVALQWHSVVFSLSNFQIYNTLTFCKLIVKGIFYETDIKVNMARRSHEDIIQTLSSIELTSQEPVNEFNYNIGNFNSMHKGFYIECENVNNISEISLKFNNINKLTYNRFLIRTKCIKICEKLLYLPMNYDKSPFDITPTGFEGSVNLSRIDSITFNIKLDNPISKICIYGLGSNILRMLSGMGGNAYNFNSFHISKNYNQNRRLNQEFTQSTIPNGIISPIDSVVYKLITNNEKNICSITQDTISNNSKYMNCTICNNNFYEEPLKIWFRNKTRKTCPMCRKTWTDFNVYINGNRP